MIPTNPLFAASQHAHHMAGEVGNKKLGYVLTGLSVVLVAIMAAEKAKELFGDSKYKEWEHHARRHEQTHAERARQTQGHERGR